MPSITLAAFRHPGGVNITLLYSQEGMTGSERDIDDTMRAESFEREMGRGQ